jgi:simple sugar transport system permease protein
VLAGACGGALWAAIPALRTRFGTNEILVSLMLVYASPVAGILADLWPMEGP